MSKKKNRTKKKVQNPNENTRKKPSFISLLINYILLTVAFYFILKSCEEPKKNQDKSQSRTEQVSDTLVQNPNAVVSSPGGIFIPSTNKESIEIENEVYKIVFNSTGAVPQYLELKKFKDAHGQPLRIIDHNQKFDIKLRLKDGQTVSTSTLHFDVVKQSSDTSQTVVFKAYADSAKTRYLEFKYTLPKDDYLFDLNVRTQGLNHVLLDGYHSLHWDMKAFSHEKDVNYEDKFTTLKFEYEDGKVGELSALKKASEKQKPDVNWVDFKQYFFSSFLLSPEKPFDTALLKQVKLFDKEKDTIHTKHFFLDTKLKSEGGQMNYSFKWYHGPNKYHKLASYGYGMEEVISLGWGIFGWINKYAFLPLFNFLKKFISNYGLIIIIMTLIVRLITSPLYYKTYISQAKQKIIRPEIEEINKKYKDNPLKRQKEIMALQSKAGVNPMAGCVPSLLFIPIFYALFRFFPAEVDLRHKSFLWIKDLSSYEDFVQLPFHIPLLGNHLSIFAVLAAIVMFFYMKMNQSQTPSMPTQEGMPDLSKMMKWMIYLSPVMMLFFFNNYASGLSLYYFVSTLLSLIIVYIIKEYVIDEAKVKAQIEENKQKPKKQSKFSRKLQALMEQAEQQKRMQEQMKNRKKK